MAVERIIGSVIFTSKLSPLRRLTNLYFSAENRKPDSEHPDYLIKWESLPYSDATWEDGALIVKKYENKIREFREREDSKRTPSKLCRALKYRPKFTPLKEQPEFIGGDAVSDV